jgi:hypothetical protein
MNWLSAGRKLHSIEFWNGMIKATIPTINRQQQHNTSKTTTTIIQMVRLFFFGGTGVSMGGVTKASAAGTWFLYGWNGFVKYFSSFSSGHVKCFCSRRRGFELTGWFFGGGS